MEEAYDFEGANAILKMEAKSSVGMGMGMGIGIGYHPDFGPHNDFLLLELDEMLLPDALHHRVSLRGQPDEDAVLCTRSKTYSVKFVATSNSAFLIPPASSPPNSNSNVVAPVIQLAPGHMELSEVAPRIDKLKSLLHQAPYSPRRQDEEDKLFHPHNLYGWDDIAQRVQASDDELWAALMALPALEIDGYWRVVDPNCMDTILRMLLHNSVLNDWSFHALNQNEVVTVLASDGFPENLALHCLHVYATKVDDSIWRLDERSVCVHFARQILRAGNMKMDSFMREWLHKVPDGMHATFDMLEGEVLTDKLGVETWVRPFSVSSLPSTPSERFSMLFRERSKWEWKDLQPYIRDLSVPGLSSEGLLLKYTRRTQPTPEAQPVFTAR